MIFLTLPELIHIGERTMGEELVVRDYGLLESALARPRASAFGEDAYLSLEAKAAALVHSLARNHGLVDGNKRLALAGLIVFLGANGVSLTLSNDEAFDLISQIAEGELDEVDAIAERIARGSRPRHVAH